MTSISAPIASSPSLKTTLTSSLRSLNFALTLAQRLYASRPILTPPPPPHERPAIKIVCISDTHNTTLSIPDGDMLLHAGDLTNKGSFVELQAQLTWLNSLPHAHKMVIAGNHDLLLDAEFCDQFPHRVVPCPATSVPEELDWGSIIYLQDSRTTVTIHGREITVYGAPWIPYCGSWAFQHPPIRDVWKDRIPTETDILLTHGPPKGHLDQGGKGCEWLVRELWRKKPRLVVFGHIHGGRGVQELGWDYVQKVYDGVQVGDRGLASVLAMAVVLVVHKLLSLVKSRLPSSTTLVNAAVVAGLGNMESRPATIVEI